MIDNFLKSIAQRVFGALLDSIKLVFSTVYMLIIVCLFSLVLHFVSTWLVITAIIVLLAFGVYGTYLAELEDSDV